MPDGDLAPLVSLVTKEEAPPDVREAFEKGESSYGTVLYTWRALAQRPEIFGAYMPYLKSIIGPGELPQTLKELVEVRTVVLNRCLYSTAHRVRSALAAGVPEADLIAAAQGDFGRFDQATQLALRLCNRLTLDPPATPYEASPQLLPEDALRELKETFSDPQIVELAATIGVWNALARFHRVMGFDLDMAPPPAAIAAEL